MRSTKYIIGFAATVCLVCGIVVAGSAESLKERQEINKQLDQKKKVLGVVSLYDSGEEITPDEIDKPRCRAVRVCPISNDGALCLAWLLGAFSPQFTAGTVWLGSKALGEVVGSAGSPGCPGSAPDGYVSSRYLYIYFVNLLVNP
jgi:hypothetical protein